MSSLLQGEKLSKRYGEKLLFENINISINEGQKIALIAKNGTGKTSLLNILAETDSSDSGSISKKTDLKISYLNQNLHFKKDSTVLESIYQPENKIAEVVKKYSAAISKNDYDLIQKYTNLMDSLNAWDYELKAKQILTRLEITEFDKPVSLLSGGEQKRVALAGVLINDADLLILDEPTNHLDVEMIEWLEDYLSKIKCAVFMVTHDRYFLENVCNSIIEIDEGQLYEYQGNYSYFLEKRSQRIENRHANVSKAKNLMKTELEWIRRMPKARTGKSKYRINEFDNIKKIATQNLKENQLELNIGTSRLGKKVINLHNISKSYDNNKLIGDFSYKFSPYEKVGIVGKNGSGKTTLLNIITGKTIPDNGRIEIGSTVKIAYYRQEGIIFNEDSKPIDIISNISENIKLSNGKSFSASGFLNYFLFSPEQQHTLVRKLSGGEKRRLYLCKILIDQPNFIIFDEPSNDLDIVTLQVLEDYLSQTKACVLIVSHDRYFMDKVVDHIFYFDGKGNIKDFPGNYTQYRSFINQVQKESLRLESVKTKKNKKNPPKQINKGTKQSYIAGYESDKIEKELKQLESEKNELENTMNSGKLNSQELQKASENFAALLDKIDQKEKRWLELNDF